ncbi:MAG: fumarylacetoacetate hydrolase family protein [Geodermatophilaceae bacterium]
MRFVTYLDGASDNPSTASFGRVIGDGVVDGRAALEGRYGSIRDVLAAGALKELAAATDGVAPQQSLDSLRLLPPITDSAKIICAGVNYRAHREETSRPEVAYPTLFTRFADTQIGHRAPALKPAESDRFDYEGELAVVIGVPAYRVSEADALDVLAGYACYNDFSVRDWQRHTSQFLPGKNFPCTGGFGPWLVTTDEIGDITKATLETRVNGEVRQSATIDQLIFSIPQLISYITTFTPLAPGDVIVTGTPGGVGLFRDPPTFLQPGDRVDVEISGVGVLTNKVAAG